MKTTTKFVTKFNDTVRFRSLLCTDEDKVPFAVSVNEAFQQLREEIEIVLVDLQYIHKSLRNTLNFESYASIEVQLLKITLYIILYNFDICLSCQFRKFSSI
jgi:hypothetical protein